MPRTEADVWTCNYCALSGKKFTRSSADALIRHKVKTHGGSNTKPKAERDSGRTRKTAARKAATRTITVSIYRKFQKRVAERERQAEKMSARFKKWIALGRRWMKI